MMRKATVDEITVACFSITLVFMVLAWQNGSVFLGMIALGCLSINLFIEAWKEWQKRHAVFFSQFVLRGIGIIVIMAFAILYI
ncbi:hypothetical protein SAMN04487943_10981 [Gracilibacillus orientalis]|uniref:DUF4181 domain-containing protein n=1 Tax=Gracilibacillus orientalis TaxID=334253 RepID=A0A1I4NQC9_9BACI|nr:hypothetical protein [Gracilibacillus orientalis]SFM17724.1 hypothetical protein SAMN04487943_10981 [Gracilibacillus orientalis]